MPQGTGPQSPLPSSRPPTLIPDYVTGKVNGSRVIPTFTPASALVPELFPAAPCGEGTPPLPAKGGCSSAKRGCSL